LEGIYIWLSASFFDTRPLSKGLAFDPKGMPDVEQPGLVDSDGHFQALAARTKETTHSADQSAQLRGAAFGALMD
jgi:hypothetical protein